MWRFVVLINPLSGEDDWFGSIDEGSSSSDVTIAKLSGLANQVINTLADSVTRSLSVLRVGVLFGVVV